MMCSLTSNWHSCETVEDGLIDEALKAEYYDRITEIRARKNVYGAGKANGDAADNLRRTKENHEIYQ